MSKGLEALKRLINNKVFILLPRTHGKRQLANDINIIQTELKALEIIKEKRVNVWFLLRCDLEEYNTRFVNQEWRNLTQEEYDLVREVLL